MSNRRRSTTPSWLRTALSILLAFAVLFIIYVLYPNLQPGVRPVPPNGSSGSILRSGGGTPRSGGGTPGQRATANVNLALGNPSGATTDPANADNYLIARNQYVLSYNRSGGIPNWVSWHLSRADMGNVDRSDFQPDTSLPQGWYQVKPSDYTGSGYDRGHLAPSADRTDTVRDNEEMFLMTNIAPQAPDNNQGPWEKVEAYCRDLAQQGNELYIMSGVSGQQGTLSKGHVRVPDRLWKVVVVLPEGDNDLERITQQTTVFAVELPNRQGIRNVDWHTYLTSIDQIQKATGYNLLANINPNVKAQLAAKVMRP